MNSAGSNDYRIQIEAVGRCAVTQVTATEIHCRPDLSSIAESVIATIQVSCSLSTTMLTILILHASLESLASAHSPLLKE